MGIPIQPSVVIVDDCPDRLQSYVETFQYKLEERLHEPVQIKGYRQPEVALKEIEKNPGTAFLLTDFNLHLTSTMNGGDLIVQVHKIDPYLPALCLTSYNDAYMATEAMRKGAWDFLSMSAKDWDFIGVVDTAADYMNRVLQPQYQFPAGLMQREVTFAQLDKSFAKLGGSVQDEDIADYNYQGLTNFVEASSRLQEQGYLLLVTIGGGPSNEVLKARAEKYKDNPRVQRELLHQGKRVLEDNIDFVRSLYPSENDTFHLKCSSLESMLALDKAVKENKIIYAATAPRRLAIKTPHRSPLQMLRYSDEQTRLLADWFGVEDLNFVKDTPGVCNTDLLKGQSSDFAAWQQAQQGNHWHAQVPVEKILSGEISFVGVDGRPDHLVERTALEGLRGNGNGPIKQKIRVACPTLSRFYHQGKPLVQGMALAPGKEEDDVTLLIGMLKGDPQYHAYFSEIVAA